MLLLEGISNLYKIKMLVENCMSASEKWRIDNEKNGWQSPIAISTDNIVRKKLPPLRFGNYERKFNVSLRNTGRTVQLDLDSTEIDCEDLPIISGGPLECDYTLDNIHFHWDAEHTIDGHKYPLEAHLVHYKTSTGSIENALNSSDGLAILAVFYDLGNCTNNIFKFFVSGVEDVSQDFNRRVPVEDFSFCGFLPKYVESYYTYHGTFNAPGITEVASWVVFSEPAVITKCQLEALSNIHTEENEPNPQKCGPEQELNDTNVIYNGDFYAGVRKFIRETRRYFRNDKQRTVSRSQNCGSSKTGSIIGAPDRLSKKLKKFFNLESCKQKHTKCRKKVRKGNRQSPIDINVRNVIEESMPAIQFVNYDKKFKTEIENEGNTVALWFDYESYKPSINGSFIQDDYTLAHVHFHWSSEHTISNRRYPLEAHFVHYKTETENLTNALNYEDGVVVLAVFYDISDESNEVFEEINRRVDLVARRVNRPVELEHDIRPESLLPDNLDSFFVYQGSMTTPKYNEVVTWIVYIQPVYMDPRQLEKLTDIYKENGERVLQNYRPHQALNGRKVLYRRNNH